jgi:hypothetical protein
VTDADVELHDIIDPAPAVERKPEVQTYRTECGEVPAAETGGPLEIRGEIRQTVIIDVPAIDEDDTAYGVGYLGAQLGADFEQRSPAEGLVARAEWSNGLESVTADGRTAAGVEALVGW